MKDLGGNTVRSVFSKKPGTRGGKAMKLSLKMALILGLVSVVIISFINISTIRTARISFTKALDKNMEDKGRASAEELSSIISQMQAISSIIYNGVNSAGEEKEGKNTVWTVQNLKEEKQRVTPMEDSGFRSRLVDEELSMAQYNSESVLLDSLSFNCFE